MEQLIEKSTEKGVILIATTRGMNEIASASIGKDRFDKKIELKLPTKDERKEFIDKYLQVQLDEDAYIILNHFVKKTQKTPRREIEKAIRLMNDYNERNL